MAINAYLLPQSLTADDLAALSEEMAALARAGVPLDQGLLATGADLPGRVGRLATELGGRLEQGGALEKILADSRANFPPAFQAVVLAGLRSGRLAVALEGMASVARKSAELRRQLGLALLYPLLVLVIAYGLLFVWSVQVAPAAIAALKLWGASPGLMGWISQSGLRYGLIAVVVTIAVAVLVWLRSRSAVDGAGVASWLSFGFLGWFTRLRRLSQAATFCDLLALLLQHALPLGEAVSIAARASGDRRWSTQADAFSARLIAGDASAAPPGFPASLCWLLSQNASQSDLPRILRQTAESQRTDARHLSQWLAEVYPGLLTLVLGVAIVSLFSLLMLWPWLALVTDLSVIDR